MISISHEVEKFTNWKIAVIVDTIEVRNERGVVVGFNFDFHCECNIIHRYFYILSRVCSCPLLPTSFRVRRR